MEGARAEAAATERAWDLDLGEKRSQRREKGELATSRACGPVPYASASGG